MKTKTNKRRAVVALTLTLLLTVQCALCVRGVQPEQTLEGTVLAAINTDYADTEHAKRFVTPDGGEEQAEELPALPIQPQGAGPMWDTVFAQPEPMTAEEAAAAEAEAGEAVCAQSALRPYRVGDAKTIADVINASLEENIKQVIKVALTKKIRLTCRYVNDTVTVWAQDGCTWTDDALRELGETMKELICLDEEIFGAKKIDTDKDGKFAIFVHDIPGDVAGYLYPTDVVDRFGRIGNVFMKDAVLPAALVGAACDCIHVNQASPMEWIRTIFIHEYQHYIHISYMYDGKTNKDYLNFDETFINEGFSLSAQMMVDLPQIFYESYVMGFNLIDPTEQAFCGWFDSSDPDGRTILTNYGRVLFFFQYVRTRYAQLIGDTEGEFPGKGIFKRVLESRDRSNQDNTLGIIADILYPADQYPSLADTDARCRELVADFWQAVYEKKPSGEHGFGGEKWADELKAPERRSVLSGEEIRGGMAAFYLINEKKEGAVRVTEADDGLRFVMIDAPSRSITFEPCAEGFGPQTFYSVSVSFTIPRSETERLFRAGWTAAGWATTPDADAPEYIYGDTVPLTRDVTLYAVWKSAVQLRAGDAFRYDAGTGARLQMQLCPERDGAYSIACDKPFSALVCNPSLSVYETVASADKGVYLTGGETYALFIDVDVAPGEPDAGEIRFRARPTYYTLRCMAKGSDTPYLTASYGTVYTASGCDAGDFGEDFLGWSTEPRSDTPDYLPGDKITLTHDTTLYAVFRPWDALTQDVPYTQVIPEGGEAPVIYARFTPPQTASYSIAFTSVDRSAPFADVYDVEGNALFKWKDDDVKRTLYADRTYCFAANNTSSLCVQLDSLSTRHRLLLCASVRWESVRLIVDGSYTLPDYRPVGQLAKSFTCWVDRETGKVYQPGDTIDLRERDTALDARCERLDDYPVVKTPSDAGPAFWWLFTKGMRNALVHGVKNMIQRIRIFGLKGLFRYSPV